MAPKNSSKNASSSKSKKVVKVPSMPGEHPNARELGALLMDPLEWRSYNHGAKFKELIDIGKQIFPTLLPHAPTMKKLGLYDDVVGKLSVGGLRCLIQHDWLTYDRLVHEFLASFSPIISHGRTTHWVFDLGGEQHVWDREMIHEHLGFPLDGDIPSFPKEVRNEFWGRAAHTILEFEPSAPSSCIKDHVWRYIHRLIGTNIYTRADGGQKVQGIDLDLMIAMDRGEPIDFMEILSSKFTKMVDKDNERTPLGGGAFITGIALACDIKVSSLTPTISRHPKYFDMECLRITETYKQGWWIENDFHYSKKEVARREARAKKELKNMESQSSSSTTSQWTPWPTLTYNQEEQVEEEWVPPASWAPYQHPPTP